MKNTSSTWQAFFQLYIGQENNVWDFWEELKQFPGTVFVWKNIDKLQICQSISSSSEHRLSNQQRDL